MSYIRLDAGFENLLGDIPHTIEGAVEIAIAEGRMTIREAEECREDYYRVFHDLHTYHGADEMLAHPSFQPIVPPSA